VKRARARREAGIEVLRSRSKLLDAIFATARAAFPGSLSDPPRSTTVEFLVNEALAFFPGTPVTIRCRSGLAGVVRGAAKSTAGVTVVEDETVPEGIIVETRDGSARIENTLEARLLRLRPSLSIELLALVEARS
jgi:vacuolar-type H+-ATPase subunit E/Vma4